MSVRYPGSDHDAVSEVSLRVESGSFTVLLGPSGCGKSTLLRTVNRLVVPYSGSIYVNDVDNASIEPVQLRRNIGYVIQAVGLFAHMTVAANIGIVPSLLGWPRARVRQRVDDLLEMVGLDPARYGKRYPRELSGGEQQRVGVARALAAQPPVLLMDEPFGAVDAIVRASLQSEMLDIAKRLEPTILFVTHDVDEALRLADRIIVMREGKVEQDAAPDALLTSPATAYVAQLFALTQRDRRYDQMRAALSPPATG